MTGHQPDWDRSPLLGKSPSRDARFLLGDRPPLGGVRPGETLVRLSCNNPRNDQTKGVASMADAKNTDTPSSKRENTETPSSKREKPRATSGEETEQILLTLTVPTGEIVKVEKVEHGGKRHELSDGEFAELAVDDETDELEAALEEAYEAGVEDALAEDGDDGVGDEELALRRLAVGRLLVRGMLRRGLRRRLIRRAVRRDVLKRGAERRGKESV
jgi:hypothetical protein